MIQPAIYRAIYQTVGCKENHQKGIIISNILVNRKRGYFDLHDLQISNEIRLHARMQLTYFHVTS